jgi:hypothetical protein
MAAEARITLFVLSQRPVWSPAMRQLCATLLPHSHGFSSPHSHLRAGKGEVQVVGQGRALERGRRRAESGHEAARDSHVEGDRAARGVKSGAHLAVGRLDVLALVVAPDRRRARRAGGEGGRGGRRAGGRVEGELTESRAACKRVGRARRAGAEPRAPSHVRRAVRAEPRAPSHARRAARAKPRALSRAQARRQRAEQHAGRAAHSVTRELRAEPRASHAAAHARTHQSIFTQSTPQLA